LSINSPGVKDRHLCIPPPHSAFAPSYTGASARFIGTDFTFEDIEERVLDDFTYRLLDEIDTIEGHKTWKVEAIPVDSSRSNTNLSITG